MILYLCHGMIVYMSPNYVGYLLSLEWLINYCSDVGSNLVIVFVETLEINNGQITINLH